jgi:DNA-directed RNA polymerase specialized sigma24 family protein
MNSNRTLARENADDPGAVTPAALLPAHAQAVFAVCLANTQTYHDAEDVMQAVFLKAIGKISSLREPARACASSPLATANCTSRVHRLPP